MIRRSAPLALLAVAALAAPASAVRSTLTLSPSQAHGIARVGEAVGPFGLQNFTPLGYKLDIVPTLLQQDLDGTISVDQRSKVLAEAKQLLTGRERAQLLGPGDRVLARSRILALRDDSLYAGLIFRAVPTEKGKSPIQQVAQIGASIYLDPPRPLRRVQFSALTPRGENRGRKLFLIAPFRNTGNYFTQLNVKATVRDASGKIVFTHFTKPLKVLPGFTVEFPVEVTTVLPAGRYEITSSGLALGKVWRAKGPLVLYGPNQVATRNARLVGDPRASGYQGEPESISATWRNTGNIRYAPTVRYELRTGNDISVTRPVRTGMLTADPADAGKTASIQGAIPVPEGRGPFTVTLKLYDGSRQLDSGNVSFFRTKKPSWWHRFTDWLKHHVAILLLGLLLIVLVVAALLVRRARRQAATAAAAAVAPAVAPAPVAPVAGVPATAVIPQAPDTVDINTASVAELQRMPGVGPRAAERIVAHREEYGPFATVDGLADVEGFGVKRVEALKQHARV